MASFGNLIAGEWRQSTECVENINPSDTSDRIGHYATATSADVADAVGAARDAQALWSGLTPQDRAERLNAIGVEIAARRDELARQLSREEGKTLPEARAEVAKTGQLFGYFAGEAVRLAGEHAPSIRPDIDIDVELRPLGVVGLITPWNFPISIPAWKAAPALACGNAVLLKPSELTNASAWSLAEIIHRHLPAGVFQLVMGAGEVGRALCDDPGVDGVSFTGSVETGRKIAAAAHGRGARLQMEMGGKNPLVIMDDADLDRAVDSAIKGAFFSTGQRCTASSRILVHRAILDEVTERLLRAMDALRVGPALDEKVDIGPLVSAAQLDRVQAYLKIGRAEGACLAAGGELVSCRTEGHFMRPALFTRTQSRQRINQEEIFGPVASVIAVSDIDEAISVANDTAFGLTAGLFTSSLSHAREFRRRTRAGMLMLNIPTVGTDYHVPFGGVADSSYGPREMGTAARAFFTVSRTIYSAV